MDQATIEANKARSAVKREQRERQRAMDLEVKQFHNARVQDMVRRQGVGFVHVRPWSMTSRHLAARGGATLAYHFAGPNRIVVSVAQCHPKDHFCKWMGRSHACKQMREGNSIFLTVPKNIPPHQVLRSMFTALV